MQAIQTETTSGSTILIEVVPKPDILAAERPGGEGAGVSPERILAKLGDVGENVAKMCVSLHTHIQGALSASKPREITVEFGITLAGEAGIPLVTNGSAEAAFKVTATWGA
jgi:hypothetical protein